ncbi:MAG: HAMP domain-containing histidine kinase, partial [Candidatus Sericytochromatia bacterium]|nr:HAMP domain-containing histidine kinase [Candidatus Sericytochromatia bacterium]
NRLEEEGFRPCIQRVDLAVLVDTCLETLVTIAETKGLTLAVAGLDTVPAIGADAPLLRRVIENLISNAVKFTESGRVRLSAEAEGDQVRVIVSDTGPGIPAGDLDRIFDRYYQIGRRRRTRHGGFGLGLAFCRQAVTAMGGRIGVASQEGHGSQFWFTVPVSGELPAT